MAEQRPGAMLHAVFFTLKDRSPGAAEALVAACHKHLADHPGTIHFSAGLRAPEFARPVNDQQFDVALVLAFASVEDHDRYQSAPQHRQFIDEQSPGWAQVRVFDAWI